MLFTAVCILLGLLIFWAHVATIMYVRKSIKESKRVEETFCPECHSVMYKKTFFGLKLLTCTKGHEFVARGNDRMTRLATSRI
jgi:hypothetical protein